MIGSFGLWSSSKGMKVVSNLVGLDKTVAEAQIVSDGFVVGTETAYSTSDAAEAANHNKIRSQDPIAGTLFSYELPINLVYTSFGFSPPPYEFTPPPYEFTPPFTFAVFGFTSPFSFTPFTVFGFR